MTDEPLQSEHPPPRAWPRQPGVHHVLSDETSHPVGSCTDACRPVDGPYVARPGWIVRVQSSAQHRVSEVQDAANYLRHRRETGNGTPREATLRLTHASSDPLDLLRDIRIDVSIDGNEADARAIHEPTGTAVEAPGLGTALIGALRDCIAAVGRLHAPGADGHQQAGNGDG